MPVLDTQLPEGWLRNHMEGLMTSTDDIALGMRRVQKEVERMIGEHWEQERENIACCAGCSHCCIVNVSVLHAEALLIEEFLREHLRPAERTAIVAYAKELDTSAEGLTDEERIMLRKRCPLLGEEGCCRIYPVRPLLCRALTSLNAEDCRLAPARVTYGEDPRVMMHLGQKALTETTFLAVAGYLESKGFPPPGDWHPLWQNFRQTERKRKSPLPPFGKGGNCNCSTGFLPPPFSKGGMRGISLRISSPVPKKFPGSKSSLLLLPSGIFRWETLVSAATTMKHTEEETMQNSWRPETVAIQGGYSPNPTEPRILPIVQSTTYKYDSADHVAKLFDLEAADHMYSRISNPTVAAFEAKIAALEGGVAAMATSSGQAASALAILNIAQAGQHVLAASTLYGGTYSLFANTLPKMGIEVTFVDPEADPATIRSHIRENTRLLFAETIGNPGLNILDFAKFSEVAKGAQIPLVIDNTFPTPFLCRPFDHGADIVIHSATKYIDGHATSVGGVIVDKGTFNWGNGKYPELTEPDQSYHGLRYFEKFGSLAYIIKARVQYMRDLGACISPFNAFLMNLGLETLHLRMERHSENAQKLAEFLQDHPQVAWVNYPGLPSHPSHDRAKRYLPKGCSGVLTFGIKGGAAAGKAFMEACKLTALVVHVGDLRSCVLHPASTTHRQLSEAQQIASGVTPDLIRLSVGLEHIDDIIADVEQALAASRG